MIQITRKDFESNPVACIDSANAGDFVTVRMDDGSAVVMIDECEWEMLRQSLAICMEHPEWIAKKN